MRTRLFLFVLIWVAVQVQAATYYVRTDGNNSNLGTANNAGGAWLTIGKAASTMVAGDTVRVQAGEYNERVTEATDGSAGNWITYIADGVVTCRGFTLTATDYIRIIGFEIYATDTTHARGIRFDGTCSNVEIINNFIHNTYQQGIGIGTPSIPSYIYIRGNTLTNIGIVTGVNSNATSGIGIGGGHHSVIEYNIMGRVGDGITASGTNQIIRNNVILDFENSYWNLTGSFHSDSFQAGSDGSVQNIKNHVYEANWAGDQIELNSHFALHQDTIGHGDTNILYRGNVAFNFGSGGVGVISIDHVCTYNNTFYKITQAVNGAVLIWYKGSSGSSDFSLNNMGINTIIADDGLSTDAISLPAGNTATLANNLGYLAGTEASYVSTANPLFTYPPNNFRLQALSPAIAAGTTVATVTSPNGSGTEFDVSDGQLFIDGWGLVDGDTITVGGTTTRITAIDGNTLTVADSVTWTLGAPVYWGTDTTPDIGAYPYGSTELTDAIMTQNGTTYTVATVGDARGVWFYVDGIPTTWDSTSPYAATIASGTVTAKAYALYAQAAPVVDAPLTVITVVPTGISGGVKLQGGVVVR